MREIAISYPMTPENVDRRILEPTASFKREAFKVLAAVFLFIVVYLLLVAAAFGLAALCALGGIALVLLKPMWITIMLGLGLAGIGIMVIIFMFKFLFKRHAVDRSGMREVSEEEQPGLFKFVRTLAGETQTTFPKRIYISPDVNASVFYDSSFWSMFLPIRKNLRIGLGLVNCVNVSEFKAIVAHEFGHFSQRSMKLGSYVYNMNQIIFNMLFENDDYQQMLATWGNASGYFTFFAALTLRIVWGIQWVLRQVYGVMNKQYMSLSRQMEFHADTVAASVTGANHLVSALRRLEIADTTYQNVFGFYERNFSQSLRADNIYPQHREVMRQFAAFHDIPLENGLPTMNGNPLSRFNRRRIVLKDQWASHPSTDDRERHLRSLGIEAPANYESAWSIFANPESIQVEATNGIFKAVEFKSPPKTVNVAAFSEQYDQELRKHEFPAAYKGFFDGREISAGAFSGDDMHVTEERLDEILNDDTLALPYRIEGLHGDLQTLDAIAGRNTEITQFEFDGEKYDVDQANELKASLQRELEETQALLAKADAKVFSWFLQQAERNGAKDSLVAHYQTLERTAKACHDEMLVFIEMQERMAPLFQTLPYDQIEQAIAALKLSEITFKQRLAAMMENPENQKLVSEEQRKVANEFLSQEWEYFRRTAYFDSQVERLTKCVGIFYNVNYQKAFDAKSLLLREQLAIAAPQIHAEGGQAQ